MHEIVEVCSFVKELIGAGNIPSGILGSYNQ